LDGVIAIEQPYTLNAKETFQHGILIPEDQAFEIGIYCHSHVMAMTRNTFVECFYRLQQAPDAVRTGLLPKRPPEPFFTTTIDGQEISFYPYTGATGKNDASRVLEVLRDETAQKLIEHGKAQDAIPDNSGQSNKQLKNSKDQQLRFNNTGYTNVPPPLEIPYKKYI
jgi:hypothetical protein